MNFIKIFSIKIYLKFQIIHIFFIITSIIVHYILILPNGQIFYQVLWCNGEHIGL
jgi:hypothetical protein